VLSCGPEDEPDFLTESGESIVRWMIIKGEKESTYDPDRKRKIMLLHGQ
jgi:hypothetical protein